MMPQYWKVLAKYHSDTLNRIVRAGEIIFVPQREFDIHGPKLLTPYTPPKSKKKKPPFEWPNERGIERAKKSELVNLWEAVTGAGPNAEWTRKELIEGLLNLREEALED